MIGNFPTSLSFTLGEEGGYSDNPTDAGGPTFKGITLATLRFWEHNWTLSLADLLNYLNDESVVQAIYGSLYWNQVKADSLPSGIDLMVFDMAVNAGPAPSARLLQMSLGFTKPQIDGLIGPITLAAATKAHDATLITTLAAVQDAYYRSLDTFDIDGAGWLARLAKRQEKAIELMSSA